MKTSVAIACTGLGHINRGYESFSLQLANALFEYDEIDVTLFGGSKISCQVVYKKVWCIKRHSSAARLLALIFRKNEYLIEQFSFSLVLWFWLLRKRPAVLIYSDFLLGVYLWHIRKIVGPKYKLLFSNGAPNWPPFSRMDHVHQLLPHYFSGAVQSGVPPSFMTVIPYGIKYVNFPYGLNKMTLRETLNLPLNKKIIISVGAINNSHKRMSYVVDEFASIRGFDNYFLILLGEMGVESKEVTSYAEIKLNADDFLITSVAADKVSSYLYAADFFILASLHEGLPRVLPEALGCGLMPIVHDYIVTRETLGEYGIYKDFTRNNQLIEAIAEIESRNIESSVISSHARNTFDWAVLKDKYYNMIQKLADA